MDTLAKCVAAIEPGCKYSYTPPKKGSAIIQSGPIKLLVGEDFLALYEGGKLLMVGSSSSVFLTQVMQRFNGLSCI